MGRGRPKKTENKQKETMTLKQAIAFVHEYKGLKNIDKPMYALGTLYNKLSSGELTNHGTRHMALLEKKEVIEKLCRRGKAS